MRSQRSTAVLYEACDAGAVGTAPAMEPRISSVLLWRLVIASFVLTMAEFFAFGKWCSVYTTIESSSVLTMLVAAVPGAGGVLGFYGYLRERRPQGGSYWEQRTQAQMLIFSLILLVFSGTFWFLFTSHLGCLQEPAPY